MTLWAALALLTALAASGCGANGSVDAHPTPPPSGSTASHAASVVDQSIGPVQIGMTIDEVHAEIGRPDQVRPSELHVGWERWTFRERGLTLTVTERDEVWDVRTRSPRYRSDRGLRVGLREDAIRRRLPNSQCREYGGPPRYRRWRICTSGRGLDGPFTRVLLIRGVARELSIAQRLAR